MARNPWMSAYLSAANRAYYTATGRATSQATAAARAQTARAQREILAAQRRTHRDLTQAWLDVWAPPSPSPRRSGPQSGDAARRAPTSRTRRSR